ncbi:MAG: GNAT family N-acetyltransferase [Candidatus Omnitrophica bacterium]|nr:GNAT family N-acetyltransferase [Candidatus Omnitrophota bacterium]
MARQVRHVSLVPARGRNATSSVERRVPRGMRGRVLMGSRLCLRPLTEADVTTEYLRWLNDPEVTRFLEVGRQRSTRQTVRRYLTRFHGSRTDFIFAMIERETGRHIGNVTLNRIHRVDRTADTGLMIGRKDLWGKGYASEAWSLVLAHAFRDLGVRKVVAGVVVDNVRSLQALKKVGFRVEGVLRQEWFVNGTYKDIVRLGLFSHEFEPKSALKGG